MKTVLEYYWLLLLLLLCIYCWVLLNAWVGVGAWDLNKDGGRPSTFLFLLQKAAWIVVLVGFYFWLSRSDKYPKLWVAALQLLLVLLVFFFEFGFNINPQLFILKSLNLFLLPLAVSYGVVSYKVVG